MITWRAVAADSLPGLEAGMETCNWQHRVGLVVSQVLSEPPSVLKIPGPGGQPSLRSQQRSCSERCRVNPAHSVGAEPSPANTCWPCVSALLNCSALGRGQERLW